MPVLNFHKVKWKDKREESLFLIYFTTRHPQVALSFVAQVLVVKGFSFQERKRGGSEKGGLEQWHFAKEQSNPLCNRAACQVEELKGKISKALKCLILSRDALLSKPCKLMALSVQREGSTKMAMTPSGVRGRESDESKYVRWVNQRWSLIAAEQTKGSFR